jgi:hypothetical protein
VKRFDTPAKHGIEVLGNRASLRIDIVTKLAARNIFGLLHEFGKFHVIFTTNYCTSSEAS